LGQLLEARAHSRTNQRYKRTFKTYSNKAYRIVDGVEEEVFQQINFGADFVQVAYLVWEPVRVEAEWFALQEAYEGIKLWLTVLKFTAALKSSENGQFQFGAGA
jgi:hypothetical protein